MSHQTQTQTQTLREHCDYTFETLKENMPQALASVSVETIRKWEHRMKRWMEAYQGGLDAKRAQFHFDDVVTSFGHWRRN